MMTVNSKNKLHQVYQMLMFTLIFNIHLPGQALPMEMFGVSLSPIYLFKAVNCQSSTLTPITGTASVCFAEKEPARRVAERGLLVFPSSSQLEQVFPTN